MADQQNILNWLRPHNPNDGVFDIAKDFERDTRVYFVFKVCGGHIRFMPTICG
jgi:hypothetical protein